MWLTFNEFPYLRTIEEDCKNIKDQCLHNYGECFDCDGKGKTTKLILDAKEFECKETNQLQWINTRDGCIEKHSEFCKCKGTCSILPKLSPTLSQRSPSDKSSGKGDVYYFCKWHHWDSCCEECKDKPFHLTKDAEVITEETRLSIQTWHSIRAEYEEGDLVLCEGYYE